MFKLTFCVQEKSFKVFSRWYVTPVRLHKISPTIPPNGWRCSDEDGSLLNLYWTCPLLQSFWKDVHRLITQITTYPIDFSAQMLFTLFLYPQEPLSQLPSFTPLERCKNVHSSPMEIGLQTWCIKPKTHPPNYGKLGLSGITSKRLPNIPNYFLREVSGGGMAHFFPLSSLPLLLPFPPPLSIYYITDLNIDLRKRQIVCPTPPLYAYYLSPLITSIILCLPHKEFLLLLPPLFPYSHNEISPSYLCKLTTD